MQTEQERCEQAEQRRIVGVQVACRDGRQRVWRALDVLRQQGSVSAPTRERGAALAAPPTRQRVAG